MNDAEKATEESSSAAGSQEKLVLENHAIAMKSNRPKTSLVPGARLFPAHVYPAWLRWPAAALPREFILTPAWC